MKKEKPEKYFKIEEIESQPNAVQTPRKYMQTSNEAPLLIKTK